jgi:hypothetical protein
LVTSFTARKLFNLLNQNIVNFHRWSGAEQNLYRNSVFLTSQKTRLPSEGMNAVCPVESAPNPKPRTSLARS